MWGLIQRILIMAGVYVHIPFCKSRCRYCDFFSTTRLERRAEYVRAVLREMELRREEINREEIRTVYFGGGTPSMLEVGDVGEILKRVFVSEGSEDSEAQMFPEITLEANPQDLTVEKLQAYREMGINRLSIGIQSFQDKHLRMLGRRHSAEEAIRAVRWAQEAGFENISVDLMYGLPEQTMEEWRADIEQALALNVPHISTYNLIYEEGTRMTQMLDAGQIAVLDEEVENAMYELIVKMLQEQGYVHYEVSNFCKEGYHSQHNSSYWNNTAYVGLGAGAHSYTGVKNQESGIRTWNVSDLDAYVSSIERGVLPQESEKLSEKDCYNEKVMLSLRTIWGLDLRTLTEEERQHCLTQANKYIQSNLLQLQDNHLTTSLQGSEILNTIIKDLMID